MCVCVCGTYFRFSHFRSEIINKIFRWWCFFFLFQIHFVFVFFIFLHIFFFCFVSFFICLPHSIALVSSKRSPNILFGKMCFLTLSISFRNWIHPSVQCVLNTFYIIIVLLFSIFSSIEFNSLFITFKSQKKKEEKIQPTKNVAKIKTL